MAWIDTGLYLLRDTSTDTLYSKGNKHWVDTVRLASKLNRQEANELLNSMSNKNLKISAYKPRWRGHTW